MICPSELEPKSTQPGNWLESFLFLNSPKPNVSRHWWPGAIRAQPCSNKSKITELAGSWIQRQKQTRTKYFKQAYHIFCHFIWLIFIKAKYYPVVLLRVKTALHNCPPRPPLILQVEVGCQGSRVEEEGGVMGATAITPQGRRTPTYLPTQNPPTGPPLPTPP